MKWLRYVYSRFMGMIVQATAGVYALGNLLDATLEKKRLSSPKLHLTLDKVATVVAGIKLCFIFFTSCFVMSVVFAEKSIELITTYTLIYLFTSFAPWKFLASKFNKLANYVMHEKCEAIQLPKNISLSWASSPKKENRQLITLTQVVVNLAATLFNPLNGLFLLNACIGLYSYLQTTMQKDLKISYTRHRSQESKNGLQKLHVSYYMTCIPKKNSDDDLCMICLDSLPDTYYCLNGHSFHAPCVASWIASKLQDIYEQTILTRVLNRTENQSNDFITYEAKVDRSNLTTCPYCRQISPLTNLQIEVDDNYRGQEAQITAVIDIHNNQEAYRDEAADSGEDPDF